MFRDGRRVEKKLLPSAKKSWETAGTPIQTGSLYGKKIIFRCVLLNRRLRERTILMMMKVIMVEPIFGIRRSHF